LGLNGAYDRSLRWVLNYRPLMGVVFLAVLCSTVYLYVKVPKGFIPDQDNDTLQVSTEAAQGTSYIEMRKLQQRVNEVMQKDPNIETFMSSIGGSTAGSMGGQNTGRMWVQLKPRKERPLSAQQVVEELRPKLSRFLGMRVFMTMPPQVRIGGRMSKSAYEFTIQGPDTRELYVEGDRFQQLLAKLPIIQDVTSDLQLRNPRVNVQFDRDKAAALGLDALQIESALYNGYGQSWVSTMYAATNQYKVILELEPQYQAHADSLSLIYLKTNTGSLVPLSTVATLRQDAGPQSINHSGQLPSVTVSFNLKPGVALGAAVTQIADLAEKTLPGNMTTGFTGTAKAFQSSLINLPLLLMVAVAVVYIVLGVLYESYIHPLTILSGLPSAGFGALLTLIVFGEDLNIYSFVGLIMLIGIVMKNAIMQIDFALAAERNDGKSPREAIHEGCLTRFRPILMTSMAALLGAIPISLGYGAGGEARRPLGLAVAGGLIFSQLLTLYLTPVVYTYMAAFLGRTKKKKAAALLGSEPLVPVRP
ncbi:MAG: efflux RND transporter permease subunit, partial [Acidobacteriota bacterium]|nr:efflux RND transporter permease subunit [Acidobacteriota bacterium]